MAEEKKKEKKDDVKFISDALKQYRMLHSADTHNRDTARRALRFVYNIGEGQWPESIRSERAEEGRPCLTSNKLRKFVAQVANREREQRISGKVRPVDDKGDVIIAEVISGMIRQIEYASDAEKVYTEAGEHAVAAGFGYFRITSEELDDSFDQELFIRHIDNQFGTYLDPDGMFGFVRVKVNKEEFKRMYPDAFEEDFETTSDDYSLWYDDENVYIAEYFYKERVKTTIVEAMRMDAVNTERQVFELDDDVTVDSLEQQGWAVVREKKPEIFKVKWAKITASQVLERGEWPGKDIPVIEIEGDWAKYDGRIYKRSLVEDAMDDQRMYNYWKTHMTETVALSTKAPYLVTTSMIKGLKKFWDVAHKKLLPYLPYRPHGNLTPRREPPPQVPTGGAGLLELCQRDIQDTIGMYDSSFGERSNERTGIAIRQRTARSDFGTLHFPDNFRRAILRCTRQLIELIPKIYDSERTIRILGEEGPAENPATSVVRINHTIFDQISGKTLKLFDLSMGKYDVVADTKIMSTRRQEMLEGMASVAQAAPNIAPLLIPEIAKAQDWPGAQDIARKVEALLPALLGIQPQEGEQNPTGGVTPGNGRGI